jgi:hypothetical protein
MLGNFSYAQSTGTNGMHDEARAQKWNPKKGQYYFSHTLTYSYHNVEENSQGEVKIWVDPVTGTMLFLKGSSYHNSNFEFIIGHPEGKYTYYETDDIGRKIATIETVEDMVPDKQFIQDQKQEFKQNCIPKDGSRTDFGWASKQYELLYPELDAKDQIWLTEVPFNVYPLYCFDLIEAEVSLPISFDYTHIFSKNQLLTEIFATEASMKLAAVEAMPVTVEVADYRVVGK